MSQPIASEPPVYQVADEDVVFPPVDLYSDEPPLESDLHRKQMELLIHSLECWWQDRQNFYVSGNLTVYYSLNQRKSEDFRGPDFFVVLGTERKERRSWAVWQEDGKLPNVIIEILSSSTAATDRGLKKQIYQDVLRVLNYFWFDPLTFELKGFNLVSGQYQEVQPTEQGWLWSQQLELYLGIYEGRLRFLTPEGQVVLTEAELGREQASLARLQAEQSEQRAEHAEQRASGAEQKAERLAEYLRRQNIDPDSI